MASSASSYDQQVVKAIESLTKDLFTKLLAELTEEHGVEQVQSVAQYQVHSLDFLRFVVDSVYDKALTNVPLQPTLAELCRLFCEWGKPWGFISQCVELTPGQFFWPESSYWGGDKTKLVGIFQSNGKAFDSKEECLEEAKKITSFEDILRAKMLATLEIEGECEKNLDGDDEPALKRHRDRILAHAQFIAHLLCACHFSYKATYGNENGLWVVDVLSDAICHLHPYPDAMAAMWRILQVKYDEVVTTSGGKWPMQPSYERNLFAWHMSARLSLATADVFPPPSSELLLSVRQLARVFDIDDVRQLARVFDIDEDEMFQSTEDLDQMTSCFLTAIVPQLEAKFAGHAAAATSFRELVQRAFFYLRLDDEQGPLPYSVLDLVRLDAPYIVGNAEDDAHFDLCLNNTCLSCLPARAELVCPDKLAPFYEHQRRALAAIEREMSTAPGDVNGEGDANLTEFKHEFFAMWKLSREVFAQFSAQREARRVLERRFARRVLFARHQAAPPRSESPLQEDGFPYEVLAEVCFASPPMLTEDELPLMLRIATEMYVKRPRDLTRFRTDMQLTRSTLLANRGGGGGGGGGDAADHSVYAEHAITHVKASSAVGASAASLSSSATAATATAEEDATCFVVCDSFVHPQITSNENDRLSALFRYFSDHEFVVRPSASRFFQAQPRPPPPPAPAHNADDDGASSSRVRHVFAVFGTDVQLPALPPLGLLLAIAPGGASATIETALAHPALMLQCRTCGKQPKELAFCGRCQAVAYCDAECQAADWKSGNHRLVCRAPPQQQQQQ